MQFVFWNKHTAVFFIPKKIAADPDGIGAELLIVTAAPQAIFGKDAVKLEKFDRVR